MIIIYCSETLTLTIARHKKLKMQRKLERSALVTTLMEHTRNEDLSRTVENDVLSVVAKLKKNWADHIARKQDEPWIKQLVDRERKNGAKEDSLHAGQVTSKS